MQRCPSLLCRKSPLSAAGAIRANDGLVFIPRGLALRHVLEALVWVYTRAKLSCRHFGPEPKSSSVK